MVKGFQNYKLAKLAIKKELRHFGFEATFYIVVHGRILAKINKVNVSQLLTPTVLHPIDQNQHTVLLLKDLFRIWLEPEGRGRSMTFNITFSWSKYP